jgi:hypothetical protein
MVDVEVALAISGLASANLATPVVILDVLLYEVRVLTAPDSSAAKRIATALAAVTELLLIPGRVFKQPRLLVRIAARLAHVSASGVLGRTRVPALAARALDWLRSRRSVSQIGFDSLRVASLLPPLVVLTAHAASYDLTPARPVFSPAIHYSMIVVGQGHWV